MNLKAKLFGIAAAVALFVGVAVPANALTSAEAEVLISVLGLSGSQADAVRALVDGGTTSEATTSCTVYTRDLTIGSTGSDVVALQTYLENGYLVIPAGVSKGYFGELTRSALANYQAAKGISPAVGYFGPITRSSIKCGDTNPTNPTTPTTGSGLEGGAGSVDEYDLDSSYSNEEVGEGTDDVEVYGLEIEASDESDLEILAVTVDLGDNEGSNPLDDDNDGYFPNGSDKFDDYASELSIWFNGDKVAEIDADEFEDDNNYRKTITLDKGVVIEMGDTETLVVAVSGANVIDSDDFAQTWSVAIDSIRYMDAQGTVITEDPGQDDEFFSFETFASSANAELKISKGDDDINDSRVIKVEDTDSTDDVEILSFVVEVEGSSDLMVDDIVVEFTVDGTASDLNDIASKVTLWMDGDEIDSVNTTTDGTVTFDNLDLELGAGDEYDFVVAVDILEYDAAGTYDLGDTISATVGETERNLWDVEDEEGEDLVNGDRTGSESSEDHTLSLSGVELTDMSATVNTLANSDASGSISWMFTLEAEDEAIDFNIASKTAVNGATDDVRFTLTGTDITIGTTSITLSSGDATADASGYVIDAGDDATFIVETVFTTVDSGDNGTYRVRLDSVEGVKVDEISGGLLLAN